MINLARLSEEWRWPIYSKSRTTQNDIASGLKVGCYRDRSAGAIINA